MLALGARAPPLLRMSLGAVALGALLLASTSYPERFGVPRSWSEAPSVAGILGSFTLAFGGIAFALLAFTGNLPRPYPHALGAAAGLFALGVLLSQWQALARLDRHSIGATALSGAALVALLWPAPWARRVALLAAVVGLARAIAFTLAPSAMYTDEAGTWMLTAPGVYEPLGGLPATAREAARWLAPAAAALVALAFGTAALRPAPRRA